MMMVVSIPAGPALAVAPAEAPATSASKAARAGPIYAVSRVSASLADDDPIGTKKLGLLCMPSGVIRWGDVATGGPVERREVVQDALEDADLPVTPLGTIGGGPGGRPVLHLRATIRVADFRLCARNYLAGAALFSGDALLDIEWRLESGDGGGAPHLTHVQRHIDTHHAASLGSIYRTLLGDAARDAAHWLLAPNN